MKAEKNIFGFISSDVPCVHLKGHESMHFVIGSMKFLYCNSREVSEAEFISACEKRSWSCMIKNNSACIQGKHHQVVIAPNGKIFIDGEPYMISDQISKERAARLALQGAERTGCHG